MSSLQIEEIPNQKTIGGVLKYLFTSPIHAVILRWNWKAAFLSALLRSPIFFAAYRKEGIALAIGAAGAQFLFRTIFGGMNGAIIQSFSKVEPAWHALLTVPLILATFSHIVEYIVQTIYDRYTGTTSAGKAITVSVIISVISAVFNLFAMRRGALLVKDEQQQSLLKDFASFPRITVEFIFFAPQKVWEMYHRGDYLFSVLTTILTSVGLGLTVGILRGKLSWGLVTGLSMIVFTVLSAIAIDFINGRKVIEPEVEIS
jgi:hypothetical protein